VNFLESPIGNLYRSVVEHQSSEPLPLVAEKHLSPQEIADSWALSVDTVRRLFEKEPGVLVIERQRNRGRRYRTLRIPQSVASRVHLRLSNPEKVV